jgi:hypothetical protein
MSKILRAITAGSAAMVASGMAFGAANYTLPFDGDGFSIDNSLNITGTTISAACPATADSCHNFEGGSGVDGLLQRRVVMGGVSYLQSIVGEGDVAGDYFASEQIVRLGVNGGNSAGETNLAQKLVIVETASNFVSDATMLGAEYDTGDDLLFGLNQAITNMGPGAGTAPLNDYSGTTPVQLTRLVGDIRSAAGNINGNDTGENLKRVAIDQRGSGVFGNFVYRTGRDGTDGIDAMVLPNGSLDMAGLNSVLYLNSVATPDSQWGFQRFENTLGINGERDAASSIEYSSITAGDIGPWGWVGDAKVEATFGEFNDLNTKALEMW